MRDFYCNGIGGYFGGDCVQYLHEAVELLCCRLKNEAVSLVDAIAPSDFALNSVLGASDGKVSRDPHNPQGFMIFVNIVHSPGLPTLGGEDEGFACLEPEARVVENCSPETSKVKSLKRGNLVAVFHIRRGIRWETSSHTSLLCFSSFNDIVIVY